VPLETVERVLGLYRDRYFDLNVRHFHEKLVEEHGIALSYTGEGSAAGSGAGGAGTQARGTSQATGTAGRCRGCCCTSTAAGIAGSRTSAGMT
jgi:hypothetical protein